MTDHISSIAFAASILLLSDRATISITRWVCITVMVVGLFFSLAWASIRANK